MSDNKCYSAVSRYYANAGLGRFFSKIVSKHLWLSSDAVKLETQRRSWRKFSKRLAKYVNHGNGLASEVSVSEKFTH